MRTIFSPNKFEFNGNDCFISIYNKHCELVAKAVIDNEDYEIAKKHKWAISGKNVVKTSISRGKTLQLSRLVAFGEMGQSTKKRVYHKDRDGLNNKKSNLTITKKYLGSCPGKRNDVIVDSDCCYILLKNKKKGIVKTKIDLSDYEKVKEYRWYLNPGGYATAKIKGQKNILLHRLLLFGVKNIFNENKSDHIDHDRLNNRRSNLRIVTYSQNAHNRSISKNNSSGFIGVSWSKKDKKWQAQISKNKKLYYLGAFNDKKDAYETYVAAAKKMYGDFSNSCL